MKTLYHGTSSVNLDSIKHIGLVPCHAKGGDAFAKENHWTLAKLAKMREPSVFVADEAKTVHKFAGIAVEEMGGNPVILTLHVPEAVFATFVVDELYQEDADDEPHAWRAHSVAPSCIGAVHPLSSQASSDFLVMERLAEILGV